MPTSKYSRFFLVLLVLIFLGQLFAQTDSTSTIDIYRQAYQSAFKDREISPDESNLLKNLQKSLNISDEAVNRIQQEIAQSAPQMRDQSGRWPLVMQNMAYGAGLYGWGIPFLLDVKDEKWYIGGEMLSLGGSFYLTYQFTKNMDISHARAQMLRYGSLIGLHATSGFCLLVAPEKPKFMVTMMMAGVPAGMIVMDRFYKKWQPSLGQSWAITQWGELGYSGVSNLYQMFDPQPKDPRNDNDMDYNEDDPVNVRYNDKYDHWQSRRLFISALGHPLGMAIERRFYADRQYTFGDGLMLTNGRFFGLFNGLMIWDFITRDTEQDANNIDGLIFRTVGSYTGTILMDRYIRNQDFTTGQAILMMTGEIAGALFAAGTGVIFEVKNGRVMDLLA
ncbi:MAG: hypothetical protein V1681_02045, partial [Candidatus Neomarinimicrobiota bacterium]